ncbi:hypothetical protein Tco_1568426, partial [Tanacetum coccineum]
MQEELLQFKIQKVWVLVDLPYGKKAISSKWVYRNKKDAKAESSVQRDPLFDEIPEDTVDQIETENAQDEG